MTRQEKINKLIGDYAHDYRDLTMNGHALTVMLGEFVDQVEEIINDN